MSLQSNRRISLQSYNRVVVPVLLFSAAILISGGCSRERTAEVIPRELSRFDDPTAEFPRLIFADG